MGVYNSECWAAVSGARDAARMCFRDARLGVSAASRKWGRPVHRRSAIEPPCGHAYVLADANGVFNVSAINRFLGDTPLRVALKLLVLSLLAGIVMSAFAWTPWDIIIGVQEFLLRIWDMGFAALGRFGSYIVLGAAVVVPVFLILRILSYRRA